MWIWIILALLVALLAYIRLAPHDTARWHLPVQATSDADFDGGAVRVVKGDLAALDRVIRESGAQVLAGSVEEGMITYIVRSRLFGFPDYITVQRKDEGLAIFSRLRFGKSDLGVNRKRIDAWLAKL